MGRSYVIVAAIGSVLLAGCGATTDASPAGDASIEPATTAPVERIPPPPGMIPPTARLQHSVHSSVGEVLLYDDPSGDQVCLYLDYGLSLNGGCFSEDSVRAYDAVIESWPNPSPAPGVLFGVVPIGADARVEISDSTVQPDAQGLWFAELGNDVTSYVYVTPEGSRTVPLRQPAVAVETTTPG